MANPRFFTKYPKIVYPVDRELEQSFTLRDIMIRSRIIDVVRNTDDAFFQFRVRDFDRPDTIAEKYYGSAEYYWVVLYSNDIFDPYMELPIPSGSFEKYLAEKYKDLEDDADTFFDGVPGAPGNINDRLVTYLKEVTHHYEDSDGVILDEDSYIALADPGKKAVSIYSYEFEANEEKRNIRLLDVRLLRQFVSEVEASLRS